MGWAGSRVRVHQNRDGDYKNCPVRMYRKSKLRAEPWRMKRGTQRVLRSTGWTGGRKRWGETRLQKCVCGVHRREWSPGWEVADRPEKVTLTRCVGIGDMEVIGDLSQGSFSG